MHRKQDQRHMQAFGRQDGDETYQYVLKSHQDDNKYAYTF